MNPSLSPSRSESRRRRWYAVGALALGGMAIIAVTSSGIGQNLVYYWTPTELQAAGDKAVGANIRLGGQVVAGSIAEAADGNLEFDVSDGQTAVRVRSLGIPPQMFREGIGVVVEGTVPDASNGVFESSRLMVSHDNEYRTPEDGGTIDVKEMMRTAEGMEHPKTEGRNTP